MKPSFYKISIFFITLLLTTITFAGSVIIVNEDSAGEGLNDQTQVPPIDGNLATTLGGQRLAVLQLAADFIETIFDFDVDIKIGVTFDPDDPNILGSAGPEDFDFSNSTFYLPFSDTWYPQALSNQFHGFDKVSSSNDISININSNQSDFYLGFNDETTYSYQYSLFGVVLHEIIHGLGFLEFTNSSTGDFVSRPSIFSRFLYESSLSSFWTEMTSSQRYTSVRGGDLFWVGSNAITESQRLQSLLSSFQYSGHTPSGHVEMYAPSA